MIVPNNKATYALSALSLACGTLSASAQAEPTSEDPASQAKLAVPVLLRGNWGKLANTSSENPEDWNRHDLDLIEWLCGGSSSLVTAGGPFVNCVPRSEWLITDSFPDVFELIKNGTGTFSASGISVTEERKKEFDFVQPYYESSGSAIWVRPGPENQFPSISGKTICSIPRYYANELLEEEYGAVVVTNDADGTPLEYETLVAEVLSGRCDGALEHETVFSDSLAVLEGFGAIQELPMGIMMAKGNQALYDSLSAGMVSTAWSGNDSLLLQWEDDHYSDTDNNKYTQLLVDSITGFDIPGFDLDYSTSIVLSGPLAISTTPINVTIVLLDANTSFARLDGDANFLEPDSQWTGIDVDIGGTICASPYFNCVDVLVAKNLDERLSLLDTVSNGISISNLSVEQERLNKHLFVQPYYLSSGCAVYVKASTDTGDVDVDVDASSMSSKSSMLPYLAGFTGSVCVPADSACVRFLEKAKVKTVIVDSIQDAFRGVENGNCTGQARDSGIAIDGYVQATRPDPESEEPISMAVSGDLPSSAYAALSATVTNLLAERKIQSFMEGVPGDKNIPPNPRLDLVSASIGEFVVDEATIAASRTGQATDEGLAASTGGGMAAGDTVDGAATDGAQALVSALLVPGIVTMLVL